MVEELRTAIGTDAIRVAYQVQVAIGTGDISGYEALARWTHPTSGLVPPSRFIPLGEEMGEIVRLGEQVLRTACRDAAGWSTPYPVAVNLSPLQLADPMLVDKVRDALTESGLDPGRLELELTESAIVNERQNALARLRQIKRLGVRVALDDFGSGYSSIEVLRSFPFDRLRLDASFVAAVEEDEQAVAILKSVADLGRTLGIPVLAEGVETAAQLEIVRAAGCSDVQGYLLGRPQFTLDAPALAALRQLIGRETPVPIAA
jgi:diguanylate cyclase